MAITYEELAQKLREEKERLTKGLEQQRATASSSSESKEGSPFGKKEEGATETTEFEKRLALESRLHSLLDEVEHALAKFEEGTYGSCDACGKPIGLERLEALPQAHLCLNCKAREADVAKSKLPPR
jgi:DnaK suppressor protein